MPLASMYQRASTRLAGGVEQPVTRSPSHYAVDTLPDELGAECGRVREETRIERGPVDVECHRFETQRRIGGSPAGGVAAIPSCPSSQTTMFLL